jgi:hypothetical protein
MSLPTTDLGGGGNDRAGRLARRTWLAWWVAVGAAWGSLRAAELDGDEFQVAFISKILPYVSWPREAFASPEAPVVVGLVGRDPFNGLLQKVLADARVESRSVEIRVVKESPASANCHALFVAADQLAGWPDWRAASAGRSVLTMAADETGGFLEQGGVFNLRVAERKLEISRSNAERARLRINSKLLRIAKVR